MRRITFLILGLVLVVLAFWGGTALGEMFPIFETAPDTAAEESVVEIVDEPEEEEEIFNPDLRTASLVAVGNIMAHTPQIEQAHIGDGEYDFSPSFEYIAPYLQPADLAIADLEVSQAGPDISFWNYSGYTGFPLFNAPQELSVALRDAGIDAMTLANNHAMDRGYDGLQITIDHLGSLGIETFGAYKSREERDTPTIVDLNGIEVALIGYTYSTNGIPVPDGHDYAVNITEEFRDTEPVINDINQARLAGADLVVVFPHWGAEHTTEPQPGYLRDAAYEMAAAGADLIIGGHPKYIQPLEWFFFENPDGTERASLAVYSQGNFISNQHYPHNLSPHVEYGLLLDFELTKSMDTGKAWISGVDYEITWVHRAWRHRILPLSEVMTGNPDTYNLTSSKVDELESWRQRIIDVIDLYGYSDEKSRAMALANALLDEAMKPQ